MSSYYPKCPECKCSNIEEIDDTFQESFGEDNYDVLFLCFECGCEWWQTTYMSWIEEPTKIIKSGKLSEV